MLKVASLTLTLHIPFIICGVKWYNILVDQYGFQYTKFSFRSKKKTVQIFCSVNVFLFIMIRISNQQNDITQLY